MIASNTVFNCTRRALLRSAAPSLPRAFANKQAFRTCAASEKKGGGSEGSSGKQEGQMMQRKGGEDVEQYSGGPSSTFFGPLLSSPWSPLAPFTRGPTGMPIDRLLHDLEDEFKIFDQMFAPVFGAPSGTKDQASPVAQMPDRLWAAVDVHENEKEFDLRIDVPGLSEKDINVKVDNGMLVISGERKQENVQEDKKVKRIERSYGSFERRFRLPATVKEGEIKAKLSNGVLNVLVPKSPEAAPKATSIKIEAGEPSSSSQSIGSGKQPNSQETVIGGAQADA